MIIFKFCSRKMATVGTAMDIFHTRADVASVCGQYLDQGEENGHLLETYVELV